MPPGTGEEGPDEDDEEETVWMGNTLRDPARRSNTIFGAGELGNLGMEESFPTDEGDMGGVPVGEALCGLVGIGSARELNLGDSGAEETGRAKLREGELTEGVCPRESLERVGEGAGESEGGAAASIVSGKGGVDELGMSPLEDPREVAERARGPEMEIDEPSLELPLRFTERGLPDPRFEVAGSDGTLSDDLARRSPSVWFRESLRLPGDLGRSPDSRRELTAGDGAVGDEDGAEEATAGSPPSSLRIGMAGVGAYSYTEPVFFSMYHSKMLLRNCTHFWDMTRPSIGSEEDVSYRLGATTMAKF